MRADWPLGLVTARRVLTPSIGAAATTLARIIRDGWVGRPLGGEAVSTGRPGALLDDTDRTRHGATAGDPGGTALDVKGPRLRDAEVGCYGEEDMREWKRAR